MDTAILDALSQQIAEDLLESAKQACAIKPYNIKNVLPAPTISHIISKLANRNGNYVNFKTVPKKFTAFHLLPKFFQKKSVDSIIENEALNNYMKLICAPRRKPTPHEEGEAPHEEGEVPHEEGEAPDAPLDLPDNDIMTERLKAVARAIILFYVDGDIEYLNTIFELVGKKSAGGRRTRKQKHRRHKTRGHKSRRHNRHSTRKHH
jgi:hypothetical protein